ncbi:MAG: TIGR03758 family integrating conjugative element protein [Herminiimonas sp.]|nr:TIGR03758 family integrating conjugative element protein [Herminiimonas sp.]
MNSNQLAAFLSAAGVEASNVSLLVVSLLCAFTFLWAAWVVRNLGMRTLYGDMTPNHYAIYSVRALIIVMVLVYLVS